MPDDFDNDARARQRAGRAAARDAEALHDGIQDELAALRADYDGVCQKIAPLEAARREIEARMDELKGPLHAKRLEIAAAKTEE